VTLALPAADADLPRRRAVSFAIVLALVGARGAAVFARTGHRLVRL